LRRCTNVHIIAMVEFEWDEPKALANYRKHGVDFADAVSVLEDALAVTIEDDEVPGEERYVTIGTDLLERVLVLVYTWRGDRIRLISARKASRRERRAYGLQR
jgi:uncharacterized DUF497 family protein